jgi:O-acetylhomoserine/O-acetylserine sulfhydrylase
LIRISVGTEHIDDIIADFEQSFEKAAAAKTEGGEEKNAEAATEVAKDAEVTPAV